MRRNGHGNLLPVRREQEGGFLPWGEGWLSPSSLFSTSPWQMMRRMQDDMDRLFNQLVQPVSQEFQQLQPSWAPRVDISQDDKEWLIEADLPGVKKEDIHVEIQDGHLRLRAEHREEREEQPGKNGAQGSNGGEQQQEAAQRQYFRRERRYGFVERLLPLPENVDEEQIRCDFKDGVLRIHLPKTAEQRQPGRRIPIGDGSQQPAQSLAEGDRESASQSTRSTRSKSAMVGAKGGERTAASGNKS